MSDTAQEKCEHPKGSTSIIFKNPGADGISEVRLFELVCTICKKVLVERQECISCTFTDVKDKAWGEKHGYYDSYE